MPLKLVKDTKQPLSPHIAALKANMIGIHDLRAHLTSVQEKDRAAAADIEALNAVHGQIQTLQESIDAATADAVYSGDDPPDLSHERQALDHARERQKVIEAKARAAQIVRQKYAADLAVIHHAISTRAKDQPRLLFNALREDTLAPLAAEFLAAEQAFLDVHRRAFAAALAVDTISKENAYGQFVGSSGINDLFISRPAHESFDPHPLMPEQRQAERRAYIKAASDAAATLVQELLAIADEEPPPHAA